MPAPHALLDATNTVSIGDAEAVANAADSLLEKSFGAGSFDRELLHATFSLASRLFAGEHPGYLACDMPYHDLRHSLDTALVMARLIDGYQSGHRGSSSALTPEQGLLGVLLALLHDTGYIRKTTEAALCGPQLTAEHESRGVEFAETYLQTTSLAEYAGLASLIIATRLGANLGHVFAGHEDPAIRLGQMLGTADLLSQLSDGWYLERCYYHLYPELVLGGGDRVCTPDNQTLVLFRDGFDLLYKTPAFYENVVRKRLTHDFEQVTRHLDVHFCGADPYVNAVDGNVKRAARMCSEGGSKLLRGVPITTTRHLAAIYHSPKPQ